MKNMFVSLLLLISISALAQKGAPAAGSNTKTTDMFAPKMGSSEILAGLLMPTGTIEINNDTLDYSGFILGFQYGYGFTDFLTVYVTQPYASYDIKTNFSGVSKTQNIKGLANTIIGAKGIIDYAPAFFYYEVNYQRAIFDTDKSNSSTNDSTAASARPSFNVSVGAGANVQLFGFGALLNYKLYQDGDHDSVSNLGTVTSTYKAGNGSGWKVYAQFEPSWKLGLSYALTTVEAYDQVTGATKTVNPKSETQAVSIYSIIPINSASEVFLEILKPEPKDSGTMTYKLYYVSASYHVTF